MANDRIVVRGAREHNLKNIDVAIPRDRMVVITGLSGSGKSSLAFDTIYAEGRRRYVESLSAYARQFLGQMDKPDVDQIEGLSPAIAIDQKGAGANPRSTVGTVTEIYDYLRLLYARVGMPHCPNCGRPVNQQTAQQIVEALFEKPDGSRVMILAPLVKDRKGAHQAVFDDIRKAGFVRVRVDGYVRELDEVFELDRNRLHTIEAVVDRLVIRHGEDAAERDAALARLSDSVETALKLGKGVLIASDVTDRARPFDTLFSEHFSCVHCGTNLPEIEPRTFSFNSPHGACPTCSGLGVRPELDPDLIFSRPELALSNGAVRPWAKESRNNPNHYYQQLLRAVCRFYDIPFHAPVKDLTPRQRDILLYGGKGSEKLSLTQVLPDKTIHTFETTFEGIIPNLRRRYRETNNERLKSEIERYMTPRTCPACEGKRLRPEALAVTIEGRSISEAAAMPVDRLLAWVERLQAGESIFSPRQRAIAAPILKEIHARLHFLFDVGLGYLTLDRAANTLSGGEAQRIRLATQIGSQLMGCLYILDEPSIGLHPRDNRRLIETLHNLRDLGNTILVVEHDEDTMRAADWIVDMGPGAGDAGGEVVFSADTETFLRQSPSLTAQYLRREREIPVPGVRRPGNGKSLWLRGARQNNLQNIDVRFPLGTLTCVTGVSGSGKSTLVIDILYRRLAQVLHRAKTKPGAFRSLEGIEHVDKVIDIDQSPIGRTPRSNPATYVNLFGPLRELFASMPESKLRGYGPGRFSFNVKGGRCEACQGAGIIQIEMQFLPDVYVPCEVCHGLRYNRETLQIKYKGKTIADVLDMTVEQALNFFSGIPAIRQKLETLERVGLGYLKLGQPATTLSGGEAQRIKLSKELARRSTGRTVYILDEPTTGLHFADIERLLGVLNRLVERGNTVIVIEHNLDVIKSADWVIDLGPEGGDGGGRVVVAGPPERVAATPSSYTGRWLKPLLDSRR
ncbi:MAG: excinuclease ABC subunit UvrA [Caldilineae bacterium]|nr:MAG: excinuclease ABC subunit UvrA [Caldilineae bacterium]